MLYVCVLDVGDAAFCNLRLESLNSTMDSSAASHKVGVTAATGGRHRALFRRDVSVCSGCWTDQRRKGMHGGLREIHVIS